MSTGPAYKKRSHRLSRISSITYLLDFEEYRKPSSAALDSSTLDHLDLLVGYIKSTYNSTTEHLGPLVEKKQITYFLLWELFKPNILAYTKCFSTSKSRCVRYEFREEKTIKGGVEYFYVKARYLDFDGKLFGETSSEHAIKKFRGAKHNIWRRLLGKADTAQGALIYSRNALNLW